MVLKGIFSPKKGIKGSKKTNVQIMTPRTIFLALVFERVTLLVIVNSAQQIAESKIKKSPLVEILISNLKPVEIKTIPVKARTPARTLLQFIFSLSKKMARNAVNIIDVFERTEALEEVVNLCPKN